MPQYDTGSPGQSNGHADAGFGQRIDHMGSTAQQLFTEARDVVEDVTKSIDLKGRVDRHPYGMLLAAAGVGYVLGGGLFTSFTGRLLRLGLRVAALPLVKDELIGFAEQALNQATSSPSGQNVSTAEGTQSRS
jgi:hypothetical protein